MAAHLLVATCGADDADGVNAVVPVGPEALLFRWRGYADPASRTRPAPRFHAPRGLMAETLTPPLLANLETPPVAGGPAAGADQFGVALWHELGCDAGVEVRPRRRLQNA